MTTNLGINLCFAVKRYLEPAEWARIVREELELTTVQFTFDLLDPWWPEAERAAAAGRIARACEEFGITIQSAYVGLAHYVPGGLLDPNTGAREVTVEWWRRACALAAELGANVVGGPLGTLSVAEAADPEQRESRYSAMLDAIGMITEHARAAGLQEFLIEPTPIAREIPSSIEQAHRLLDDLDGHTSVPVGLTLDVGHTVYEPLYGPEASTADWIQALGSSIRMIHLDNTDRKGDPHWGWPHEHGTVDVATFGADLRAAGLGEIPVILEVYPRFEDDDQQVRELITSSVRHCREALR